MTTENQRDIESKTEAPALENEASTEGMTEEQLESVAGGLGLGSTAVKTVKHISHHHNHHHNQKKH